METVLFTQLSANELRALFKEELHRYFSEHYNINNQRDNEEIKDDKGEELLTIRQAGELLRLSLASLYKLVRNNAIPVCKKSKKLYFFKHELLTWVKQGRKFTCEEIQQQADIYLQDLKRKRKYT